MMLRRNIMIKLILLLFEASFHREFNVEPFTMMMIQIEENEHL